MTHFGPAAMRIAIETRIPDLLVANPQGLSVTELAEKTGIDSRKLRKVMRALATRHCFREGASPYLFVKSKMHHDSSVYVFSVEPDVFANSRLSATLVDSPSTDLLLLMTGIIHEGSFSLPDTLSDPQFGPSNAPSKSAFMYFRKDKGMDGTIFSYLGTNVSLAMYLLSSNY
jgi:hypothetical protein